MIFLLVFPDRGLSGGACARRKRGVPDRVSICYLCRVSRNRTSLLPEYYTTRENEKQVREYVLFEQKYIFYVNKLEKDPGGGYIR